MLEEHNRYRALASSGSQTSSRMDDYLLFFRWVAVSFAVPLSIFDSLPSDVRLPLPILFGVAVGLNLPVSLYGMTQRAFATGHSRPVIIADAIQASLLTLLTGGYHSPFFPLFGLLTVELALALPARQAAVWVLGVGGLHVLTAVLDQAGEWTALGAYMTVAKFLCLMIIGLLAVAFCEQYRSEQRSRRATEEYAEKLSGLNEQFQQFEQARQSFLSTVAHELRTPLTVMKTLLPNLNAWDRMPTSTRQEILALVEHNLDRLESLTNDFLESTRLEAGAITLRRQPLDLSKRGRSVMRTLEPLFTSKQQKIIIDLPWDLPSVNADRRRVDQVLSSLLHNAYKFAPVGGIIRISARSEGPAVKMCVEDNGPGVPKFSRERIFEKFYSSPSESGIAGVGLGLYICRQLVALHGGDLWYEEPIGGGSCFCFRLPLASEENRGESDAEDIGN